MNTEIEYVPLEWVNEMPIELYMKLNNICNSKGIPICPTIDQMLKLLGKKRKDYNESYDNIKLMTTVWKDLLKALKQN